MDQRTRKLARISMEMEIGRLKAQARTLELQRIHYHHLHTHNMQLKWTMATFVNMQLLLNSRSCARIVIEFY